MNTGFVVAGLLVGFIVGMTGVGGGSLMTPILLYFGINPATAVGTDLLYASITKASGVWVHHKHRNIDWRVTGWLAAGSVPAALIMVVMLHVLSADAKIINALIKSTLGIALLLTSAAILGKPLLQKLLGRSGVSTATELSMRSGKTIAATVLTGVVLGVIVTLSSIGAGALGTVALFALYPLLPTSRLVGTDIAHAVPLTLVAGLGHAGLGNLDLHILGFLLLGSLPGIYVGSHLAGRLPDRFLRPALAVMLALVGAKLIY